MNNIENRISTLMIELTFERNYEKRKEIIEEIKAMEELKLLRLQQKALEAEIKNGGK